MSVKGPPYCKYLSGELVLQGSQPNQPAEVWEFSVDDDPDEYSPMRVTENRTPGVSPTAAQETNGLGSLNGKV